MIANTRNITIWLLSVRIGPKEVSGLYLVVQHTSIFGQAGAAKLTKL